MAQKPDEDGFLEKIYGENTIIGIIIIALMVFFGKIVFPDQITRVEPFLIPLFILVVCIEILFIRKKLTKQLNEIRQNTSTNLILESFRIGDEFDNWLENILRKSSSIKVAHLSSFATSSTTKNHKNRRYSKIIETFIEKGNTFHRVICDTENIEVFDWILGDLNKYKSHRYFISFLEGMKVKNIKNISFMIIDNEYLCLGGGYKTRFNRPTIAIKNKDIVSFYNDYFNHLATESKSINLGGKLNTSLLEKRKIQLSNVNYELKIQKNSIALNFWNKILNKETDVYLGKTRGNQELSWTDINAIDLLRKSLNNQKIFRLMDLNKLDGSKNYSNTNIISIGGPKRNNVTREILKKLAPNSKLKIEKSGGDFFKIKDNGNLINDSNKDYAILYFSKQKNSNWFVFAGLTRYSTLSCIQSLLSDSIIKEVSSQFGDDTRFLEILFSFEKFGEQRINPEIVSIYK